MRAHDGEYAEFVVARGTALLRTAHLLARGPADAEDLLQTALVKTYLSWPRLRDVTAAEAYTRRILVNTSISWWRLRRNAERPTSYLPDQHVPHPAAEIGERAEMIAALRQLSPQQRAVLVLRFYEDQSEAQIAETLGMAPGTVKSHASRGLARLRELLGDRDELTREEHR
ncbi:MAG TPA: SigE family RNA polymerase sigma factor [Nocardioidaceae bacterium]|nr:SigE family RNA polymerase sigma factor [Nocardioidaceae bacterium]